MKMIFMFALVSALAMSSVLGLPSGPSPKQMTYVKEDETVMQSEKTAQIMDINDRSSNLKFVIAIKSSTIWEEIKKRSLTINSPYELDDTNDEKSLEKLSDQELVQLKKACNDGLKCVSVDHLLVLEQVKVQLGDGKVSVRMAVTKITQVLTQYTTEYYEDVYQYEAVSVSDDESKEYKSVTTIIEDNKELCRIDLTPTKEKSPPKYDEGSAVPTAIVNNNNTVNYNTTKYYNINNGTINSATINVKPQSGDTDDKRPTNGRAQIDSTNRSPDQHDVNADHQSKSLNSTPATGDKSNTKAPKNYAVQKLDRQNHALDSETSGQHYEPVTTTSHHPENERSTDAYRKPTEPVTDNRIVLSRSNGKDATRQTIAQKVADDGVNNNTITLKNNSNDGTGGGNNDFNSDVVSTGSHNKYSTKRGMVEDGILNNGLMKAMNTDNINLNKGTIKNANTDNGIINVGTTNNGPVNYGTAHSNNNTGTMLASDRHDINQQNHAMDSGTSGQNYEPVTTTSCYPESTRPADDNQAPTGYSDNENNNNMSFKNGVENGQSADKTKFNHDIVSAGSDNLGIVKKGYVEDGVLNNGNMEMHNINNGTINKGTISDSNAKNGIIAVGTVNNGPANYGSANNYADNGKQTAISDYEIQQYLSDIDSMYSKILERLG